MNMVNLNASVKDVRDQAGHPGAPPRKGLPTSGVCSGLEGYTPAHYFITRNDDGYIFIDEYTPVTDAMWKRLKPMRDYPPTAKGI